MANARLGHAPRGRGFETVRDLYTCACYSVVCQLELVALLMLVFWTVSPCGLVSGYKRSVFIFRAEVSLTFLLVELNMAHHVSLRCLSHNGVVDLRLCGRRREDFIDRRRMTGYGDATGIVSWPMVGVDRD